MLDKRLRSRYTVEANYWRTQSMARPFCNSRATCYPWDERTPVTGDTSPIRAWFVLYSESGSDLAITWYAAQHAIEFYIKSGSGKATSQHLDSVHMLRCSLARSRFALQHAVQQVRIVEFGFELLRLRVCWWMNDASTASFNSSSDKPCEHSWMKATLKHTGRL